MSSAVGHQSLVVGRTSIRPLLDLTEHWLDSAGVLNPRVDAEWLLAHVLGVRRDYLWLHADQIVSEEHYALYTQLLARRRSREPLQYILGTQEFYGRPFRVTPDVLIPRPETEQLVETALPLFHSRPSTNNAALRILDLCTGSGCIAITIALECPAAQITATDISAPALAVASDNARQHAVTHRITFCKHDVLTDPPLTTEDARFDLVIANPPYCPTDQWAHCPPEVRCEPRAALVAGKDGLAFVRRIIKDAPRWCTPDGWLVLEIGDGQATTVRAMLDDAGFTKTQTRRDYQGTERILYGSISHSRRPASPR